MAERTIDWDKTQVIAEGADSVVYLNEDGSVFKHYVISPHTIDSILRYRELTNAASSWLRENPEESTISLNGNQWVLETDVLPILEVRQYEQSPLAVCKYVPGPNLDSMTNCVARINGELSGVQDPEKTFLKELEGLLQYRSVFEHFYSYIDKIADTLNRALRVKKIEIVGVNVKIRASVKERTIQCVVTDLGNSISALSGI